MCGIAGILTKREFDRVRVPDLAHRGPDGAGTWTDGALRLWHWRLRVIDLSPAADQPFLSADGTNAIVYNGEIYNAPALRSALSDEGVVFRSHSDTEVLLQSAVRRGDEGIEALRGMYAFALWNGLRGRLTLARDPFGIKPLYVYVKDGTVCFASELVALLDLVPEKPAPNLTALWHFFTYGFVPAPLTAFKGISKVMPGELLEFDRHGTLCRRIQMRQPWIERTPAHRPGQLGLREAIVQSVSEQFVADVPVGLFLSGGIDSNVILAAAREAGIGSINTFTVRFQGPLEGEANDETGDARLSAKFFGTHHQEIPVELGTPEDLLEDLHRFGEPFANPTVLLTRVMSREARRSVTVALSGAGGDEIFAGYPRYAAMRHRRLLAGPFGQIAAATAAVAGKVMGRRTPRALRRVAWVAAHGETPEQCYLNWAYFLGNLEKCELLPGLASAAADSTAFLGGDFIEGVALGAPGQASDLSLFLPNNILAYTDIGSMAASLEMRVPFLDPDVSYLGLRSVGSADLAFRTPKATLRHMFARDLPPHVLRARKKGFNPPLALWIRGPLDALFEAEETRRFREDIVNEGALASMRLAHRRGVEDYSHELLSVLAAASWYRKWC
jgi:asparagine synthase (glutamine-hydrolysing)